MDARGRLTPVDVAYLGVALFFLGILAEPIYMLLAQNIDALGTGDVYMVRMIIPGAIVGLFVTMFAIAIQGR
jgi:hypothetical protein